MPNIFFVNPHNGICGGNKIVFEQCNHLADFYQKCFVVCDDVAPDWMPVSALFVDRSTALKLMRPDDIIIFHWDHDAQYVLNCPAKNKFYLIQHFVHDDASLFQKPFRFLSVSSYIQQHTKKFYGVDSELILNAIDHAVFYPRSVARESYQVFAIDLGGWKGVDDVKKAERLVKKRFPQAQFVYRKGLKPDQMAEEYSRSAVFVSASWYEGFGLPPLEAMACGCAVVCTDSKGVDDFALDNQTCLKIPPRSPKLMAERICQVLSDDKTREMLSRNGLAMAKRFQWADSINRLAAIFGLAHLVEEMAMLKGCAGVRGFFYGDPSVHRYGEPVQVTSNILSRLRDIKGGTRLLNFLQGFGMSERTRRGVFDYQKIQFVSAPDKSGIVVDEKEQRWLYIPASGERSNQ